MGLFGATHGLGGWGEQKGSLPKMCHAYGTMMKLRTVTQRTLPKGHVKIHRSRDTPLEFT